MNDRSFDSVARDAAGVSRRESIFALGAAGLMAAFAGPLTADARKKGKKKNKKQAAQRCPPAPDLCAPQVGPCTDFLTILCSGDPSCLDCEAVRAHERRRPAGSAAARRASARVAGRRAPKLGRRDPPRR